MYLHIFPFGFTDIGNKWVNSEKPKVDRIRQNMYIELIPTKDTG